MDLNKTCETCSSVPSETKRFAYCSSALTFNPPSLNHLFLISSLKFQSLFHIQYLVHKGNPIHTLKALSLLQLEISSRLQHYRAARFSSLKVHHIWVTRRHPMLTRTGLLLDHGVLVGKLAEIWLWSTRVFLSCTLNHSQKITSTGCRVAPWNDWTCHVSSLPSSATLMACGLKFVPKNRACED